MNAANWAAIFIAIIAAFGSWASHRAAGKASIKSSDFAGRVEMEKEAYVRARKLDTDTIDRQDAEMREMRDENKQLRVDNMALHKEVRTLQDRLNNLEQQISNLTKEQIDDY